jgi:ferrochelatase
MSKVQIALLVINFGGPRDLEEVPDFLEALLTDKDVIRTPFPDFLQDLFFKKIARKRSVRVAKDYGMIGGKSPIFEDTEWVAKALGNTLNVPAITFHRYLRKTHKTFVEKIHSLEAEEIWVFPMFPQFSYATTGSIARWLAEHLSSSVCKKLKWVASYPSHEKYVEAFTQNTKEFLAEKNLKEEETVLLFSAHGLPESFIKEGDPYQKECEASFQQISSYFPKASSLLSYQSKFGRAQWVTPSTIDMCHQVKNWIGEKKHIVFLPLSFTSDHIETLFEIEQEYLQYLQKAGYSAYRCPALGRRLDWVEAMKSMIVGIEKVETYKLIRSAKKRV